MCKIYDKSVEYLIISLEEKIELLNQLKDSEIKWSKPNQFSDSESGVSKAIGCYKIIYKPTMKVMGIGQGNISNRKARHKSVFLNGGVDIIHENGTSSGSPTAGKMFRFDSDLENWLFSWCDVGSKELAQIYEDKLIREFQPEFNSEHMAGK